MARDTKLGPESITRDIPNVSEEALRNLDEAGIVYIGAEVKAGDILVGKVTPKGETPMTPEEKLLRAIFGEKAADVRDTSLKVPPGVQGTIVEVRVFNRRGVEKDERAHRHRAGRDRASRQGPRRRARDPRAQHLRAPARGDRSGRRSPSAPKGIGSGGEVDAETARRPCRAGIWWEIGDRRRRPDDRDPGPQAAARRRPEGAAGPLREQGREAAARRRAAARRAQDGQGLLRGEAQAAAGRQDGRPARQQGRHLADSAHRGHAASRGRLARRSRPQSLGRALADECRADPRDPSGLGLRQSGRPDRASRRPARDGNGRERARGEARQRLRRRGREPRSVATSDQDLAELGENLRPGVPMATPVFDGAHEVDIVRLLEEAGCDRSGQVAPDRRAYRRGRSIAG